MLRVCVTAMLACWCAVAGAAGLDDLSPACVIPFNARRDAYDGLFDLGECERRGFCWSRGPPGVAWCVRLRAMTVFALNGRCVPPHLADTHAPTGVTTAPRPLRSARALRPWGSAPLQRHRSAASARQRLASPSTRACAQCVAAVGHPRRSKARRGASSPRARVTKTSSCEAALRVVSLPASDGG